MYVVWENVISYTDHIARGSELLLHIPEPNLNECNMWYIRTSGLLSRWTCTMTSDCADVCTVKGGEGSADRGIS